MKKTILLAAFISSMSLSASEIIISRELNEDMKVKIQRDFERLEQLTFKDSADSKTLAVMGLKVLNAQTASEWLHARVSYVVEEIDYKFVVELYADKLTQVQSDVVYPNAQPNLRQIYGSHQESKDGTSNIVRVMSNLGSTLYKYGKSAGVLNTFNISGQDVLINSPRVGIIQVGSGLFASKGLDSWANTIDRLATYFHEARHSDGNGKSLAFTHSICPAGHDFAGYAACDESLNGAYSTGAVMLKEMIKTCDENCTVAETEVLKLELLDLQNRVQTRTQMGEATTNWDANPESL